MSVRTIRRTEITVERERRIELAPARAAPAMCVVCASPMLDPSALATILGVSMRDVYRGIERSAFHFDDPRDGRLTVCLHSAALSKKENR